MMKRIHLSFLIILMSLAPLTADPNRDLLSGAKGGDIAKIEKALAAGANINRGDNYNITPLMYTIINRKYRAAKFLVKKGADVNAKNRGGMTAAFYCAFHGGFDLLTILVDNGASVSHRLPDGRSLLYVSAWGGSLRQAKYFISKGCDVNGANNEGRTVLMAAVFSGDADLIKYLVKKGARINGRDKKGHTPLMIMALSHYPDTGRQYKVNLIRLMLRLGANKRLKDNENLRAYDHAMNRGEDWIARLLR